MWLPMIQSNIKVSHPCRQAPFPPENGLTFLGLVRAPLTVEKDEFYLLLLPGGP